MTGGASHTAVLNHVLNQYDRIVRVGMQRTCVQVQVDEVNKRAVGSFCETAWFCAQYRYPRSTDPAYAPTHVRLGHRSPAGTLVTNEVTITSVL